MQEKRKRSKTGIIIAAATVVLIVVLMIVWQQYEAKHEKELKASVLTANLSEAPLPTADSEPQPAEKSARVIPDDPEKILSMAEEALADEGYFEPNHGGKGFHVYFLLKKCLNCDGDPHKVEVLAGQLKELSGQSYGSWYVEPANLTDLNDRIKAAKQM